MKTREIVLKDLRLGGENPLFLIAGPCVVEGPEITLDTARQLKQICGAVKMPLVFKASFDKANRSSATSFRGQGMKEGLDVLAQVKRETGLPILTDIHEPQQADPVAEVADILQIPAMLCRQTDLLIAAGETGKPVNVKKGQFLAPGDMRNVIDKIKSTDNEDILLTERGTTFGYHYLVNDMRALPSMRMLGYPVVYDGTHSVQLPGGMGDRSGGDRQFVPALCRAAVATGVDGVFLECHPDPDNARSDGPNMLRLEELPRLLELLQRLHKEVRAYLEAEQFDPRPIRAGMGHTLIRRVGE